MAECTEPLKWCEGYEPHGFVEPAVCEWHLGRDNPLGHPDPKCKGCHEWNPRERQNSHGKPSLEPEASKQGHSVAIHWT